MSEHTAPSKKLVRGISHIGDAIVRLYISAIIISLLYFMFRMLLGTLASIFPDIFTPILAIFTLASDVDPFMLERQLLHGIAFSIVLVKAYRILMSYATSQHINLKFLVEITIIAPLIELIFNAESYDLSINILFAATGITVLLIYLFFYNTFEKINRQYQADHEHEG